MNDGRSGTPPIVAEELKASGQPIDSATRAAIKRQFRPDFSAVPAHAPGFGAARSQNLPLTAPDDPRERAADRFAEAAVQAGPNRLPLGFDLGRVRLHTGPRAAESAAAIQALAYTSGHDVVFGAGQFDPHSRTGRRLLFHELAHTMQPRADRVVQRTPDSSDRAVLTQAERARKTQLDRLAELPLDAHRAWKNLQPAEKAEILSAMSRRYGADFAEKFLAVAETGKFDDSMIYYQPRSGPNVERLMMNGYRRAGEEITGNAGYVVELWVHPSGKTYDGTSRRRLPHRPTKRSPNPSNRRRKPRRKKALRSDQTVRRN